jgi:hypothetical protein
MPQSVLRSSHKGGGGREKDDAFQSAILPYLALQPTYTKAKIKILKHFQFGEYCVEEYTVCSTPVSSLSTENMETTCSNAKEDNTSVMSGEFLVKLNAKTTRDIVFRIVTIIL